MYNPLIALYGLGLISSAVAASPAVAASSLIPGPFSTKGSLIANAKGQELKYAGVNWPAAGETMVPEGLQWASIQTLVKNIKDLGMNTIRLTWAVEMVDNIYDKIDVPIVASFVQVLGRENGTFTFNKIKANNPWVNEHTKRLDVFDAIAEECAKQGLYVHLDNHVSKAQWCCGNDGNGWWGDTYFDYKNWKRALTYMAEHGGKAWPTFISMSLRNELRVAGKFFKPRNKGWPEWYGNMTQGASAIHTANPDLLIFFSGLELDTELRPIFTAGDQLGEKGLLTGPATVPYTNKIVLEVHDYPWNNAGSDCATREQALSQNALAAMDEKDPVVVANFPVVVSEWGYPQSADQLGLGSYADCLSKILPETAGWMIWVLAGSYYIREGTQEFDEGYGLLAKDWKTWRCQGCMDSLIALARETLGNVKGALPIAVA